MADQDAAKQRDIANIPPALARERFGKRKLPAASLIIGGTANAFVAVDKQNAILEEAIKTWGIRATKPPTAVQLQGLCGPNGMDVLRGYAPFDRTMVERVVRSVTTKAKVKPNLCKGLVDDVLALAIPPAWRAKMGSSGYTTTVDEEEDDDQAEDNGDQAEGDGDQVEGDGDRVEGDIGQTNESGHNMDIEDEQEEWEGLSNQHDRQRPGESEPESDKREENNEGLSTSTPGGRLDSSRRPETGSHVDKGNAKGAAVSGAVKMDGHRPGQGRQSRHSVFRFDDDSGEELPLRTAGGGAPFPVQSKTSVARPPIVLPHAHQSAVPGAAGPQKVLAFRGPESRPAGGNQQMRGHGQTKPSATPLPRRHEQVPRQHAREVAVTLGTACEEGVTKGDVRLGAHHDDSRSSDDDARESQGHAAITPGTASAGSVGFLSNLRSLISGKGPKSQPQEDATPQTPTETGSVQRLRAHLEKSDITFDDEGDLLRFAESRVKELKGLAWEARKNKDELKAEAQRLWG